MNTPLQPDNSAPIIWSGVDTARSHVTHERYPMFPSQTVWLVLQLWPYGTPDWVEFVHMVVLHELLAAHADRVVWGICMTQKPTIGFGIKS